MKKIYNQPNMKVAIIDATELLCQSPEVSEEPAENDGNGGYTNMNTRETTNLWDKEW